MRHIEVRGAREHNLRDVSVVLPRNQLIVFAGVSGSGKSSLAFDTLYAEGQRRYLESLSSYARQFIGQLPKPNVDYIAGLSPAVSISQKSTSSNPRSTVGTITEIYDFLRVLMARVGIGFCPTCNERITSQTRDQITNAIGGLTERKEYLILAPLVRGQKGEYRDLFDSLRRQGYARARIDGQVVLLSDAPQLGRQLRHDIEVVVARIAPATVARGTLSDAVHEALKLGENTLIVCPYEEPKANQEEVADSTPTRRRKASSKNSTDIVYSSQYACPKCSVSFAPPSPQLLSFNSPQGMCSTCEGLGKRYTFAPSLLVPDPSKSIRRGAIEILGAWNDMSRWQRHQLMGVSEVLEKEYGLESSASITLPWDQLPEPVREGWLYGTGDRHITFTWRGGQRPMKYGGTFGGLIPQLLEQYRAAASAIVRKRFEKYMETRHCDDCNGARLGPQARSLKLRSSAYSNESQGWKSLPEICSLSIHDSLHFLSHLELNDLELKIAGEAIREVTSRLQFLLDVGLDYLTLARPAPSLSGGEAQRIRLASQIGAGLIGVLYVLDEPSIGLHPRDNDRLIESLKALRDQGNSLIVVEHDEDTMRAADLILDFGPGPGVRGGELVAFGSLNDLAASERSLTGKFLSGEETIPVPAVRRPGNAASLRILGAEHNNLKNIDVSIPLGKLVCITGVSGSGKSSLIGDILVPVLRRRLHAAEDVPGKHRVIEGIEHLDKIIDIDQSPIGRTPRSNPGTYVKVFDEIRSIFAELPEAKRRGYAPGRFSFNMAGGRCEACEGNGSNKLEMDFLADLWITCNVCEGRRYNRETLQVMFKGKSIADVLEMDIQQALELFQNVPRIAEKLQTLHDVGLDYIKLGQPSPTLSGGEAQRVKLAKELSRRDTGRTLYLLDEPTTGLHFHDIRLLLKVLQDLVDRGNSVLVVEHNLDIIRAADWLIDLGPEGGEKGGQLVFEGTPDEILNISQSHTGVSLAKHISNVPIGASEKTSTPKSKKPKQKSPVVSPVLKVQGATQHNLKDVSLELQHNALTVFCGPSGSGKSSLAMDTIYAEGQRRYVESLSSYARQFVGQMPKPPVERIEGLAPAIAIEQKSVAHNPRSTVGTVTEVYDYLRVLMARLAVPHCPECDVPVTTQTAEQVTNTLLKLPEGTRLILTAPLDWQPNQAPADLWQQLRSDGHARVRAGGKIYSLETPPRLALNANHDLQIVIDRVVISTENRSRIAESVELALSKGGGLMYAISPEDGVDEVDWPVVKHSQHLACSQCGLSLDPLTPHSFSFNTQLGWCEQCEGLGTQSGIDPGLLIDVGKSLANGAIRSWPSIPSGTSRQMLETLAKTLGMSMDMPLEKMTSSQRRALYHGTGERWYRLNPESKTGIQFQWHGLMPTLEHAARLSPQLRNKLGPFIADVDCSSCDGSRLSRGPSAAKFRGLTVGDLTRMPLRDLHRTLAEWKLDAREQSIAGELLTQITARTEFLLDVGLDYLSLSRAANSLSGGESQRIRLASQLGSGLCGVLYVLDEPTIGLHPRDNAKLLRALYKLRDLGNTLIVVEHDREVIAGSDELCDFGPGAGRFGGELVAQAIPKKIPQQRGSVTGPYLSGKASIPIPASRRKVTEQVLSVLGARAHTLRNVDVDFPIGLLTVVTGPSGSGKSSLVNEVLYPALSRKLARQSHSGGVVRAVEGLHHIDKVIRVDQSPLGSNPSSTPATYTGAFDLIRQLYAQLPNARARGFTARQFSFNVPGGRCEKCEGQGQLRIEMHFLPDVWITCDSCQGKRFTEETLSVKYHEFSIHDMLEMQIGKALEVLSNIPKIRRILQTLVDVGLDYVALGQSAPTLSGGEAQRVKLATELARPDTGRTLYLLDEPTTGLHFGDVAKLLEVIQRLVDLGNTVVVIEHNLDIIKAADYVIDLGPEAGRDGGQIVVAGTPEEVAAHALAERAAAETHQPRTPTEATPNKKAKTKRASTKSTSANEKVLLRSYTGEALAPVLAEGTKVYRQKYDPLAALAPKEDDVELDRIGRDTLLPWQADGRRWHTQDSVDRKGGAIRWDRQVLVKIIELIEKRSGFAPVNWDNRSIVEITSTVKSRGWFMHAITGETWLLKVKFRVPRGTFTKQQLLDVVQLPTLNQMEEIESYGNEPRVKARQAGAWMELELHLYQLAEIDSPKFWQWIDRAMSAFLDETSGDLVDVESSTIEQHMPWKVLGQRWHTLRKGFPPGRDILWPAETLSVLVQVVHQTAIGGKWRWDEQTSARFFLFGMDQPWITVHTKRPEGLIVMLAGPEIPNRDELASTMPVTVNWTNRGEDEQLLQMAFVETQQPRDSAFRKLLSSHLKGVLQKRKSNAAKASESAKDNPS